MRLLLHRYGFLLPKQFENLKPSFIHVSELTFTSQPPLPVAISKLNCCPLKSTQCAFQFKAQPSPPSCLPSALCKLCTSILAPNEMCSLLPAGSLSRLLPLKCSLLLCPWLLCVCIRAYALSWPLFWVELRPLKRYFEIPTPHTCDCDIIWKVS